MDVEVQPCCDVEHWPSGDSSRPHRADPLSTLVLFADENESTGYSSRLLAIAVDQLFKKTAGLTGDQTIWAHSPGVKQRASFHPISRAEVEGTKKTSGQAAVRSAIPATRAYRGMGAAQLVAAG